MQVAVMPSTDVSRTTEYFVAEQCVSSDKAGYSGPGHIDGVKHGFEAAGCGAGHDHFLDRLFRRCLGGGSAEYRELAGRHPVQRAEEAPGRRLRDHRRLEPLFPAARARHEIPQYARDQLLGPEVQRPDAVARMSAAYAIALPIRHDRAWPGHPRKRKTRRGLTLSEPAPFYEREQNGNLVGSEFPVLFLKKFPVNREFGRPPRNAPRGKGDNRGRADANIN